MPELKLAARVLRSKCQINAVLSFHIGEHASHDHAQPITCSLACSAV
jgi:hypothetical protein